MFRGTFFNGSFEEYTVILLVLVLIVEMFSDSTGDNLFNASPKLSSDVWVKKNDIKIKRLNSV
jgi:hypothetical protein